VSSRRNGVARQTIRLRAKGKQMVGPPRTHAGNAAAVGARDEDVRVTGGAEGDRTPDLVIANDALSQLSYDPTGAVSGPFA
jgi:hypothetical protein